ELRRDRHLDRLLALLQDRDEPVVDAERVRHPAQLSPREVEGVLAQMALAPVKGRHRYRSFPRRVAPPAYSIRKRTTAVLAGPASVGQAISRSAYAPGARDVPAGLRPVRPKRYVPGSRSRCSASRP